MTHTLPQILDILSWAFTALAFLLAFAVHHHVPLLLFDDHYHVPPKP